MKPDYVAYSGLIIDDIVLPDGRTYFNTLGGSGTHALVGMRLWSDRLGYFAAVGSDFDPAHRERRDGMHPAEPTTNGEGAEGAVDQKGLLGS